MKFSYNWLQSFFKDELPEPKELAEILTMKSFEVEEMKKNGNDWLLNIDILPNRAHDCLSHFGLARECAALLKNERGQSFHYSAPLRKLMAIPALILNAKLLSAEIEDVDLVPRYSAYIIEGVEIKESPDWIKERLASVGQKSINNVVDITNFIMWELGQPLHAFDLDKIKGGYMNIRRAKKGESVETLDGEERKLQEGDLIIEDKERIIDLAGIKGGGNTEIDKNTKRIIFQAAIFNSSGIRKTSQRLGLRTDAAALYAHGFDPNLPSRALPRAFELLRETALRAKLLQTVGIYPNPEKPKRIELDINYANKLLGAYLSIREIKQILERLGFDISRKKKFQISNSQLLITVPSYRLDIGIQEDLVEEIGRIYGYENIGAELPRAVLIPPKRNHLIFWRRQAREILAGLGFSEVYNYSMIAGDKIQKHLPKDFKIVELQNPMSDEFGYLRPTLFPGVLKNFADNERYFKNIKIFEFGKVFQGSREEKENVIFALGSNQLEGFYAAKGFVDEFLNKLGISGFYYDPSLDEDEFYSQLLHPGKRANVRLSEGKFVGIIGEAHPSLVDKYEIKNRVFFVEFDFEALAEEAEEEHIYTPPVKYPEVVRDISMLLPGEVMVADALNVINSAGGELIRDVDLFDMYSAQDKKSLAFHLIFQSTEKTLTSKEVDEIMERIIIAVRNEGWEVR